MIFGGNASYGWRMAARTVSMNKKNPGGDQIFVVGLVQMIALMPVMQRARAISRARHDLAKHRDTEGSNQFLRPDAHSLQAWHSHKWDIS
jgi:hypothetical protein